MGIFSDLFKSKSSTVTQEPMMESWQLGLGKSLSELINKYLPNYQPGAAYTGNLSAPMTGYEGQGLSVLQNYLNSPNVGELFGASKNQLLDTLGGKYADPNASPYIKSMMNLSKLNLGDILNQVNAQRGVGGNYFHTQTGQQLTNAGIRSQTALDAIIGEFMNQERGRQLGAVNPAMLADEYEMSGAPLAKIGASQTYGALERTLAQANMERQYNEFQRQQGQLEALPGQAQSMFGTNIPYGIKSITTKSPSTFMKMMGEVSPTIGSYNTQKYGYDVNQSSLSGAMKAIMSMMSMGGGGGGGNGAGGLSTTPTTPGYWGGYQLTPAEQSRLYAGY